MNKSYGKFAVEAREAYKCGLKRFYSDTECVRCGGQVRSVTMHARGLYNRCVQCVSNSNNKYNHKSQNANKCPKGLISASDSYMSKPVKYVEL